jgi:hypothetical protein
MLARLASSSYSRRRLLGGLAAVGVSIVAAGCGRGVAVVPTRLATQNKTDRHPGPTPVPTAGPPVAPGVPVGAIFGKVVVLDGVTIEHDTVKAGDDLRLWLHWQLIGEPQEDFRSIGRLVTAGGRVVASEDDQIGGRRRHLTRWQVGERGADEMRLQVTANAAPGEYGLAVGVLRLDNLTTVPMTGRSSGATDWQEDAVLVGTVVVTAG